MIQETLSKERIVFRAFSTSVVFIISAFWNHFTLKWKDTSKVRLLKSQNEVKTALDLGEVEQFNGTPDSHPTGFVVNCPVPVLAPNTFSV